MRCVLVDGGCFVDFPSWSKEGFSKAALCSPSAAYEGLEMLRRHARVVAVIGALKYPGWLIAQRRMLVQELGFSLSDIFDPPIKSAADGDVYLSPSPLTLLAWKARRSRATALLWHVPENYDLSDEPTWTRVCDWQVVAWFARGRSLAVGA